MGATLKAYAFDGTALDSGNAIPFESLDWSKRAGEDFTANALLDAPPAAVLAENVIYRINNGTKDVAGFVALNPSRPSLDADGSTRVELSMLGVRHLLHRIQVLPEPDCPVSDSRERWLGWMSVIFDDSGWSTPESFGTYLSGPFATPRPDDWVDGLCEFITIDTDPFGATNWGARATYTPGADGDYIISIAGDDELRLWVNDAEVASTLEGGPYQWKRYQQFAVTLESGTEYTFAVQVRNLYRASEATNVSWLLFSLAPANSNGETRNANQVFQIAHDHTGGTFTLATTFGEVTDTIAHDADAATVQSTLEANATVGAGNVEVTGSGTEASPWTITFVGDLASKTLPLTADFSSLTGGANANIVETTRGRSAGSVLRSNTTDWVVQDFSSSVPGLTPRRAFRELLEEGQARGDIVADDMTIDGTDAADPDSTSYPEINLPVSLPADLHRVSVLLEEGGFQFETAPDLAHSIWVARGSDVSATVDWTAWSGNATDHAPAASREGVVNALRVRTQEGWHWVTDAASITARGRHEGSLDLSQFSGPDESEPYTTELLARYATPANATRFTVPEEASKVPEVDAGLCDIVSCSAFGTSGLVDTDMRVVGIDARVEESSIVYTVEVVD